MNTSVLNPIAISPTAVLAVDVSCSDDALHVRLSDGREVSVPLEWFPRLRDATPKQRANWRLIARGIGIHWEDVDEFEVVGHLARAFLNPQAGLNLDAVRRATDGGLVQLRIMRRLPT